MVADGNADIGVFKTVPEHPDRGRNIVIEGETSPEIMKTWFFEAVKRCTTFYNSEADFKKALFEGESAAYDWNDCKSNPNGTTQIMGLRVGFNLESLQRGGKDFSDLKEPILFHEAMEIFYKAKPGKNVYEKFPLGDRRATYLSHFLAMVEEYRWLIANRKVAEFREWYHQDLNGIATVLDKKAYEVASKGEVA